MNRIKTSFITPSTTVGEIVADNYNAAGILKKHGLDFCCGGGKTLEEACNKNGINPEELLEELEGLNKPVESSQQDFNKWSPDHLIDHIEQTHHQYVRSKINEISGYAAKVASVKGEQYPEVKEVFHLFNRLIDELLDHLHAEEETVFPGIRKIYEKRLEGNPVETELTDVLKQQLETMVEDHDEAGNVMRRIRGLTNAYTPPEGACTTFRILYQNLEAFEADLHKHVHLENNILFKKAEKLIA